MAEMDTRIVQMIDEAAAARICELEAELAEVRSKSSVWGFLADKWRSVYEQADQSRDKAKAENARLRAALGAVERWSNAHLGWSVSLAGHVDGVYEEIAAVGRIARDALVGPVGQSEEP